MVDISAEDVSCLRSWIGRFRSRHRCILSTFQYLLSWQDRITFCICLPNAILSERQHHIAQIRLTDRLCPSSPHTLTRKLPLLGISLFPLAQAPREVSSLPISSSKHEFVDYDQSVDDYKRYWIAYTPISMLSQLFTAMPSPIRDSSSSSTCSNFHLARQKHNDHDAPLPPSSLFRKSTNGGNISLLISVRTLLIKFTSLPFTLAASLDAPKAGSLGVLPHPTVFHLIRLFFSTPTIYILIKERVYPLLRARNLSSESTATALTRRMDTMDFGELAVTDWR